MLTGFVAIGQTVLPPGTAAVPNATATAIAQAIFLAHGTAAVPVATTTRMSPKFMTTNDTVLLSPRGSAALGTTQIALSHARVASVGSASAVIEVSFVNGVNSASATLVPTTFNMAVFLTSTEL